MRYLVSNLPDGTQLVGEIRIVAQLVATSRCFVASSTSLLLSVRLPGLVMAWAQKFQKIYFAWAASVAAFLRCVTVLPVGLLRIPDCFVQELCLCPESLGKGWAFRGCKGWGRSSFSKASRELGRRIGEAVPSSQGSAEDLSPGPASPK